MTIELSAGRNHTERLDNCEDSSHVAWYQLLADKLAQCMMDLSEGGRFSVPEIYEKGKKVLWKVVWDFCGNTRR